MRKHFDFAPLDLFLMQNFIQTCSFSPECCWLYSIYLSNSLKGTWLRFDTTDLVSENPFSSLEGDIVVNSAMKGRMKTIKLEASYPAGKRSTSGKFHFQCFAYVRSTQCWMHWVSFTGSRHSFTQIYNLSTSAALPRSVPTARLIGPFVLSGHNETIVKHWLDFHSYARIFAAHCLYKYLLDTFYLLANNKTAIEYFLKKDTKVLRNM